MAGLLLYCRSGFENDVANEVQEKASQLEVFGYSFTHNNSPLALGILRLKFPHDAPSRSTLKLDARAQSISDGVGASVNASIGAESARVNTEVAQQASINLSARVAAKQGVYENTRRVYDSQHGKDRI